MSTVILVTGGTGMLGSHLLLQLVRQGHKPRALYRSAHKLDFTKKIFAHYETPGQNLFDQIEWRQGELEDIVQLEEAMQGVSQVYHCAARVSFAANDATAVVRTNVEITTNVLNTALACGVQKLVHVSSVAALGRAKEGQVRNEKTQWIESKENSAYARGKYLSELEAWRAYEEGLELVIVNPAVILGPGNWQEGSAALFGKIARGFNFYSHGVNAYVDVRDVAAVMQQLMESKISGERFVLMAEHYSYHALFDAIARALGVKPPQIEARPWMGEVVWRLAKLRAWLTGSTPLVTPDTARTSFQKCLYSNRKIKQQLGYQFKPVAESIEEIASIYEQETHK